MSLLLDQGIPLKRIALSAGHSSQATTEAVYRKQLRPMITQGAEAMEHLRRRSGSGGHGRPRRRRRGGLIEGVWPPVWPSEHDRGRVLT
ncbi:hypothetical protein ACIPJS_21990 [Streptomyces sp. NPDC086783]|uniref:hypothetical protein n=1 Tax=Streptomyces sp. NPDC086783 TaxID=3365758 RepID=UPI00380260B8